VSAQTPAVQAATTATGSGEFLQDVLKGLQPGVRKLSPKYFYDDVGARLFEEITTLAEYYPTRVETGILQERAGEMAHAAGPGVRLVEFGSGSGEKTRILLRHLEAPQSYVPVDIAAAQLRAFAASLQGEFPGLRVQPLVADYTRSLQLPAAPAARRTVAFFPGSTIGNFEADEAAAFLGRVAGMTGAGGGMLLGTDMHKPKAVLEAAYNDARGVTAAFNLNVLARMNAELGADFDLSEWRHHALYDEARRRIEMRLVAERDVVVTVPVGGGRARFRFRAGEWITTEYSHKYTPDAVRHLAARTGWQVEQLWTDEQGWFGVWYLTSTGRR
jgi:L-histidine Nalpha-methyltransferase